jgi:hypothetical protein
LQIHPLTSLSGQEQAKPRRTAHVAQSKQDIIFRRIVIDGQSRETWVEGVRDALFRKFSPWPFFIAKRELLLPGRNCGNRMVIYSAFVDVRSAIPGKRS